MRNAYAFCQTIEARPALYRRGNATNQIVINSENGYPVLGRDVDQEMGALVPADGDVFTEEKDVELTGMYNLHL